MSIIKKILAEPLVAINVNMGRSLAQEGMQLAKWGVPAVIFAGWMIFPALNLGGGDSSGDAPGAGSFKFDKEETGSVPTLK